MARKKFSVLLLRPDYLADTFGQDTYLAHVYATDVAKAIEKGQNEVAKVDSGEGNAYDPEDYYVLLCTKGHIVDLAPHD